MSTDSEDAYRIARETKCDFEGCNGDMHEPAFPPEEWNHQVWQGEFDDGTIEASICFLHSDGKFVGAIELRADAEMSAAEFRDEADRYDEYPAWLRGIADMIDGLNAKWDF